MYKKVMALLLVLGLSLGPFLHAQETQKQRTRYYYYPSSNVYLDPATHNYWYFNDSAANWVTTQQLPPSINLKGQRRYALYYQGMDVWKDNALHSKKYHAGGTAGKPKLQTP